jgi:hypothetical protein
MQLPLSLLPLQRVEIKQLSIIPCGNEIAVLGSFQAIHHFWEGEQGHQSNVPLDSLLRTPTQQGFGKHVWGSLLFREESEKLPSLPLLPQTYLSVCEGKEIVDCRSIKGKEEFMEALGKHFSTVNWNLKVRRLTF